MKKNIDYFTPEIIEFEKQYEEEMSEKFPPRKEESYCYDCENPAHLCICAPMCGDCLVPITDCGCKP